MDKVAVYPFRFKPQIQAKPRFRAISAAVRLEFVFASLVRGGEEPPFFDEQGLLAAIGVLLLVRGTRFARSPRQVAVDLAIFFTRQQKDIARAVVEKAAAGLSPQP